MSYIFKIIWVVAHDDIVLIVNQYKLLYFWDNKAIFLAHYITCFWMHIDVARFNIGNYTL